MTFVRRREGQKFIERYRADNATTLCKIDMSEKFTARLHAVSHALGDAATPDFVAHHFEGLLAIWHNAYRRRRCLCGICFPPARAGIGGVVRSFALAECRRVRDRLDVLDRLVRGCC